ncbi:MAG: alpha/beta hydrolase [Desulfobacterales bacterium]|nr:alpha/beta hydrolase [Desulfobacterales bacterium]
MIVEIVVFLLLIASVVAFLTVRAWTHTPHGRLDTRAAILLKVLDLRKVDLFGENRTPDEIRQFSKKNGAPLKTHPDWAGEIRDETIAGKEGAIPIRRYWTEKNSPSPVLLYFHGGGWVMGDLDTHDNICRALAQKTGAVVVAVDYRLAPEHPFPAAFDDAYATLEWAAQNAVAMGGDPNRIFVAGDSAGANLAATVSLAARDRKGPAICGQALAYPATDLSSFDRPSCRYFAAGYYLTLEYMEEFRNRYLPRIEDRTDPYASPLLALDLKNLPPALVITAGFDMLRDEGEAFADGLRNSGVPVTATRYDGMIHGFLSMDRLFPQAGRATDGIADFVRSLSSK